MVVFVLDNQKQPLILRSEKRARLLLKHGRAVAHKRYPFTIRLKDRSGGDTQSLRLKLNPGSKSRGAGSRRRPACSMPVRTGTSRLSDQKSVATTRRLSASLGQFALPCATVS